MLIKTHTFLYAKRVTKMLEIIITYLPSIANILSVIAILILAKQNITLKNQNLDLNIEITCLHRDAYERQINRLKSRRWDKNLLEDNKNDK